MSMIICPDCGQSISSNAPHCIHCGCVFCVCPECETVLAGETNVCPECGFQLIKEEPKAETESKNEKSLLQWYKLSMNSNSFITFITKPAVRITLRLSAFALAAFVVIRTLAWGHTSGFEEAIDAVLKYEETLNTNVFLLILGAVLWVIASIPGSFDRYLVISNFNSFASVNSLNLPDLIDKEFKRGFDKITLSTLRERVDAITYSLISIRWRKDIFDKVKDCQGCWIALTKSALFAMFFCIFAVINTEAWMKYMFWQGNGFAWDQIQELWLPIAGIILYFILGFFVKDTMLIGYDISWMKENLPQHMDAYTKYVADYNSIALDLISEEDTKKMY